MSFRYIVNEVLLSLTHLFCLSFLSLSLLSLLQGIYAAVVYVFMSCHTLTWKHKHYPIKEDVEPLSIPEEPEFFGESYPSIYGSQESLIPRVSHVIFR